MLQGNDCPKCKQPMLRRSHGVNETKHLRKVYYYSQWDVCRKCKHIQHYEQFKVYPKNIPPYILLPEGKKK